MVQLVKNPPTMWETWVRSLGWEDTLEKGKATHSSILAWRKPWTIQSMGSQRVGHYRVVVSVTHHLASETYHLAPVPLFIITKLILPRNITKIEF